MTFNRFYYVDKLHTLLNIMLGNNASFFSSRSTAALSTSPHPHRPIRACRSGATARRRRSAGRDGACSLPVNVTNTRLESTRQMAPEGGESLLKELTLILLLSVLARVFREMSGTFTLHLYVDFAAFDDSERHEPLIYEQVPHI